MASESPEADVIVQQDGAWGDDGEYGDAENQQASHIEHHSLEEVQDPNISVDPAYNASGDIPSDEDEDEDAGEYDPETVIITTTTPAAASAGEQRADTDSPHPTKKPKKAGGFIVGSSDDEDDAPTPSPSTSLKLLNPADGQSRTFSRSPLQQSTTQDAPGTSSQVSNGHGAAPAASAVSATKSRLPTDIIGILEDRVRDDPRGGLDSWLALIEEHRRRNMIEQTRAVYERFFKLFPQASDIWVQYLDMELSLDNFQQAEGIFQRTLLNIPSVQLWTTYLDYIRRRNDLNDTSGQARQVVNQAYDFVLEHIGLDRDSGRIWRDYIQFIKSGPGQVGGSNWQDAQKMDVLRKAYQRVICVPMPNLNAFWKEYDQFELGLNKVAGRKFLQERSPAYMTAKTEYTHLERLTQGLQRSTLPRLPPAPGFEGDQEYLEQVELWKNWIAWEKSDPLVLKTDEPENYKGRILHVYKQALMALRFWPEIWVDAAEWCFENNITSKDGPDAGLHFLMDGIEANPESSLLALKHADRIEADHNPGKGDDDKTALGQAVRVPYDKVLTTLYDMIKKLKERETTAIAQINSDPSFAPTEAEEEDEGEVSDKPQKDDARNVRIKAVRDGFAVQIQMLSQQISSMWIALARAFRRMQGQGKGNPPSGVRAIFTEARSRGRLTSEVYVAVALIEWDIYQDPVATKIFERGAKLFPEDEHFMVSYLKHLHSRHDTTNARVVFSQAVKRFKEKEELLHKLKPLYAYFHSYEAKFGELAQIKELEKQMAESFPEDPTLSHFAARFSTDRFNPITARVIISPASQMRPKNIMPSVERPLSASVRGTPAPPGMLERSPRPQFIQAVNSPKRPLPTDDYDDLNPPRKLARGASPLKGAAGRRLDQQRRAQGQGASTYTSTPAPISRDITFLLGQIPAAQQYNDQRYRPESVVRVIQSTNIPDFNDWKATHASGQRSEQSRTHVRQVSNDYASLYPYAHRDSPVPSRMFGGQAIPIPGSNLRPDAGGDYEPQPNMAYVQTTQPSYAQIPYYGSAQYPPPQQPYPPPSYGGGYA